MVQARAILPPLALIIAATGCATRTTLAGMPDADRDAVPDHRDDCPEARETHNRHNDHDGCPDHRVKNRALIASGIVTMGMGVPHMMTGILFVQLGAPSIEDNGHPTTVAIGITLIVAACLHEVIGLPLIVAGVNDAHWSDEESPPVEVRADASGVGLAF